MIKFQIGQVNVLLVPHKNVAKEILLINPHSPDRKTIWIFTCNVALYFNGCSAGKDG